MKLRFLTSVLSFAALMLAVASPVYATSWFDGGKTNTSTIPSVYGAKAEVEGQNPYVASGSLVSAWAMMSDPTAGHYAQTGWLKYSSWSKPKYYYEYTCTVGTGCPNGFNQIWLNDFSASNPFDVMEVKNNGSGSYVFSINGSQVGSVSTSSTNLSSPKQGQFFGEVQNVNDQSPGSVSNPVSLSLCQVITDKPGGTWVDANNLIGPASTLSTQVTNRGTTNSFEIWDSRY